MLAYVLCLCPSDVCGCPNGTQCSGDGAGGLCCTPPAVTCGFPVYGYSTTCCPDASLCVYCKTPDGPCDPYDARAMEMGTCLPEGSNCNPL